MKKRVVYRVFERTAKGKLQEPRVSVQDGYPMDVLTDAYASVDDALDAIATKFPHYWGDLVIVMEVQDAKPLPSERLTEVREALESAYASAVYSTCDSMLDSEAREVLDTLVAAVRADEKAKCIAAVLNSNERCEHFRDGMSLYEGGAYIRVSSATGAIRNA